MTEKVWSISFATYMYDNVMCLKKLNLVALDSPYQPMYSRTLPPPPVEWRRGNVYTNRVP